MFGKKILFLSPHPDDVEFYCGGVISKLVENHNTVMVRTFSICTESLPKGLDPYTLQNEFYEAMEEAGIKFSHIFDWPVRRFNEHRQDILENLVEFNNDYKPDVVFIPSAQDIHQDHQVIYQEGLRAFKNNNIISYEVPLNNFDSSFNLIIPLERRHVDKKLKIIARYKSQSFRPYSDPDYVVSILQYRGAYVQTKYAEAFKIIKWIG